MQKDSTAFDPTVMFSVYGSWWNTITEIKRTFGADEAFKVVEAIANYSMFDEQPDFSEASMLRIWWPVIAREIDISIGKRKRFFANDEMDGNIQKVRAAIMDNPGASIREIERITGVSKSTVGRIVRKYKNDLDTAMVSVNIPVSVNVGVGDNASVNDNDNMGRDRDGTVGQPKDKGVSMLDKIIKQSVNAINLPSERAFSVRAHWKVPYREWLKGITNQKADAILHTYLSTNDETPEQKRFGDKYGRIVKGWDEEKREPIIEYSFTGFFPKWVRHRALSIPADYYSAFDEIDEEAEETDLPGSDIGGSGQEMPF